MSETNAESPKVKLYNAIYYVSALFLPSILLFNLYNNNRVENHLIFWHVLMLAGIFAVVGLLAFLFFRFATGNLESAFLLSILFWVFFWLFENLFGFVAYFIPNIRRYVILAILGACLITAVFLLRRFKPPHAKIRPALITLAACFILLFFFNLIPGISHMITLQRNRAPDMEFPQYIKHEFIIDENLPSPDIHWVHLDGMMSLETVERFWELDLNAFREELALRGFLIYENALLNAGFTDAAMPALLSPEFYDSFLSDSLIEAEGLFKNNAAQVLDHALTNAGLTFYNDIFTNLELLNALSVKEYDIIIRNSLDGRLFFYNPYREDFSQPNYLFGRWHISVFMDLPELLNLTTPLNIDYFLSPYHTNSIRDIEKHAQFNFSALYYTHVLNWDHYPPPATWADTDWTAVHLYPSAYEKMTEAVLNHIDSIIGANPDSVIVLQADHGFHVENTQQFMLDQGYSLEEVLELIYSVFSAVRIPPTYGGLDAPIAPLNISRELVNRFVGVNYELLP